MGREVGRDAVVDLGRGCVWVEGGRSHELPELRLLGSERRVRAARAAKRHRALKVTSEPLEDEERKRGGEGGRGEVELGAVDRVEVVLDGTEGISPPRRVARNEELGAETGRGVGKEEGGKGRGKAGGRREGRSEGGGRGA